MALQRKKGYSIESKTARFTLLRDGLSLDETKTAFNDLVTFYFAVVATHPEGTTSSNDHYRVYEGLTIGENVRVDKGFACHRFSKISRRERHEGLRVSNEIISFANRHGCKVIVFEHLASLKPQRGRYSRRSNQKRAYWLKGKIFENVRRIAYQKYAILTARVNPKDTSRLCAVNGVEVWRGNHYLPTLLEFCQPYQYGGKCFATVTGQRGSSGLNAARNIGLKFLARKFELPRLELKVEGKGFNVAKAKLIKVGCPRIASKVNG